MEKVSYTIENWKAIIEIVWIPVTLEGKSLNVEYLRLDMIRESGNVYHISITQRKTNRASPLYEYC